MGNPKSKKSNKKLKANTKEIKPGKHDEENQNPFDFGGLPQRDLKKNLGCR
ncbi:MAG: hypothetical protein KF846_07190 [Cyclobacteriaceae bacterium]|nr:hypothetical protein [Cyclobacteriaceae bacterium]